MNASDALSQCLKKSDFAGAIVHCNTLLNETPDNSDIIAIKGWSLYKTGQIQVAEQLIFKALDLSPSKEQVVTIAMSVMMGQCRYEKIIEISQKVIAFHPNNRLMWHRLGTSHHLLGEYESSIIAFRRARAIKDVADSAFGISMPLLNQGCYEEAFQLYENRFISHPKLNWIECERLPMPKWQGEPLEKKALLVWSEQGLGDSIQFARLATVLVESGADVDFILQASHGGLADLLATIKGVGQVTVVTGKTISINRRYDFHSPLMSLMGLMKIIPKNIPAAIPYVSVPAKHDFIWDTYAKVAGLKVGLVWTTLLTHSLKNDNHMHYAEKDKKSLPLAAIEKLLSLSNIHFFILQLGVSEEDKTVLNGYSNVSLMSEEIKSFSDTAAIVDKMDLVISIDTSVVHLAGAMGKPTINLLPYVSDWRWLKAREDSPWYPTMRLCKQAWKGNWDELVDRVIPITQKAIRQFENGEVIDVTV